MRQSPGTRACCKSDEQEHVSAEVTFEMKADDERSQPCKDRREGGKSKAVGTHSGTRSLPTWRTQARSPLLLLWQPGLVPSPPPPTLCPAVLCWCSHLHVAQDTAPGAGPEVAHPFTLYLFTAFGKQVKVSKCLWRC